MRKQSRKSRQKSVVEDQKTPGDAFTDGGFNEGFMADEFKDKRVRKKFVAKVYAIVSFQLLISGVVITGLMSDEGIREFLYDYAWLAYVCFGCGLFFYFILVCCESIRKSYPCNFVLLSFMTVFVIGEAAVWSAQYEIQIVFLAMLGTGLITIVMSFFAKFAPCDVTGCGFFFLVAFTILFIVSIGSFLLSFFLNTNLLDLILASVSVVVLSFYLVFLTQLILGGRRGSIPPDETVLAVIVLYTTIIEIFLDFLFIIEACFNASDDD